MSEKINLKAIAEHLQSENPEHEDVFARHDFVALVDWARRAAEMLREIHGGGTEGPEDNECRCYRCRIRKLLAEIDTEER